MTENEWKVGDYAMSRGMPVRVIGIADCSAAIELVSADGLGMVISSDGYRHSVIREIRHGGLKEIALSPITDPAMLLLCRAHEAQRLIKLAKQTIAEQEKVLAVQTAGLRALQDAQKAIAGGANG